MRRLADSIRKLGAARVKLSHPLSSQCVGKSGGWTDAGGCPGGEQISGRRGGGCPGCLPDRQQLLESEPESAGISSLCLSGSKRELWPRISSSELFKIVVLVHKILLHVRKLPASRVIGLLLAYRRGCSIITLYLYDGKPSLRKDRRRQIAVDSLPEF